MRQWFLISNLIQQGLDDIKKGPQFFDPCHLVQNPLIAKLPFPKMFGSTTFWIGPEVLARVTTPLSLRATWTTLNLLESLSTSAQRKNNFCCFDFWSCKVVYEKRLLIFSLFKTMKILLLKYGAGKFFNNLLSLLMK